MPYNKNMNNQELAKVFSEIAQYLEMEEIPFKPQAYEKVSETLGTMSQDISDVYKQGGLGAVEEIPGVGENIAKKIEEYLKTGKVSLLEEYKKKIPIDINNLSKIEGLGPKRMKRLYDELGIRTINDLDEAIKEQKIRDLTGFGEKSEDQISIALDFFKSHHGRFILGFAYDEIQSLKNRVGAIPGVRQAEIAGSARRMKETIGDLDILVMVDNAAAKKTIDGIVQAFSSLPEVRHIYASGESKVSVRLESGYDADLRIFKRDEYAAGLLYFTGSKEHNIWLRKLAIENGMKLNEYGLFSKSSQTAIIAKTEKGIYRQLGLPYFPPETRERFVSEKGLENRERLDDLIDYGDLKGDLQIQTSWSDGQNSIEECANQAIEMGYEYILITDHSKRLGVAHGLDARRARDQWREIDKINDKMSREGKKIRILKGIECDILRDGSLDLPDKILQELDLVGVSVHSYFNLPLAEQTKRIEKAMENKHVDIVFHPTARQINRREEINLDIPLIIKRAKETGTALEIDSFPDRLDLRDDYIYQAAKEGVKLVIDSDSHSIDHFRYIRFGIAQARRGLALKKNVLNTQSVDDCLKTLQK